MKKREPVSKIMSTDLLTVNITNTLFDVKEIFNSKKVGHLPVVSGDKVVGILSKTDFAGATYFISKDGYAQGKGSESILHTMKIDEIMTSELVTVSSTTLIHDVAEIFAENQFHSLPVVDDEKLKGIVTTTDVIKYLLEQY